MYTLIVVLHVMVSLILIVVVLLQAGKGAEMGAAFGGSSQTIFGSRGAATFLSKLTVGAAVVFMVTSLTLSMFSRSRSVLPSVTESSPSPSQESENIPTPVETPEDAASE